jgi:hypothetical protein
MKGWSKRWNGYIKDLRSQDPNKAVIKRMRKAITFLNKLNLFYVACALIYSRIELHCVASQARHQLCGGVLFHPTAVYASGDKQSCDGEAGAGLDVPPKSGEAGRRGNVFSAILVFVLF